MKNKLLVLITCIIAAPVTAQQIDVAGLGSTLRAKPVKVNGGINATMMAYGGNEAAGTGRDPFSWFLQGNLNMSLFGKINLPFSFNLTNSGKGYTYPVAPNRLSLHPMYKSVTGHIGDVSMSFSPYTLNGLQFRGVGVDVAPTGPWKVSAMYGRLQKAVLYDSATNNTPYFERWGYGGKINYQQKLYRLGVSAFYAKDKTGVPQPILDSLLIYPQQNLSVNYELYFKPAKGMDVSVEYATSALTNDIRDSIAQKNRHYLSSLIQGNSSTAIYHAYKAQLNYTFNTSTIGVGYERVDPGYKTLGAYYFNNDLENITINLAQAIFHKKATIAANVGVQKDNLNGFKAATTRRWVSAFTLSYNPTANVQTSASYSSFQTHMNMQSQFEYINNPASPYQNLDTLNYVQLSQNANVNVNIITRRTQQQQQMLNVNLSFQDASDEQGGIVRTGNSSQFYNLATSYGFTFIKTGTNLTLAYNLSYNTIAFNDMLTQGPTLGVNNRWLQKKLTTTLSASYNSSSTNGQQQSSVFNTRVNAAYKLFKKHALQAGVINQYRTILNRGSFSNVTGTLGYNYSF
ncbi:hypothetical protein SAMN05421788_107164 [Filimonas lacunae]|uniref:Uncharacterized protein n=1 Tax=Filimonas lacunae TaxID=477680 RepID=A0A173MG91_9BACT|nr:hypothetical protein [Filimonas lacunae]BAV06500.1 hypothetical protein FLA_2519 [Filimonas lacunae]SIT27189.1 hypothetical protein SAMN05421788_107164 [Filimonas lacunae]